MFGPEKCPVYLKLPWICNVSSKFEMQIYKTITSCFYAVNFCVVYSTRVMLPSVIKDSVPTAQTNCVIYEFSFRCRVNGEAFLYVKRMLPPFHAVVKLYSTNRHLHIIQNLLGASLPPGKLFEKRTLECRKRLLLQNKEQLLSSLVIIRRRTG